MKCFLSFFIVCCVFTMNMYGQEAGKTDTVRVMLPLQKFYVGNGLDAAIFSTASIQEKNIQSGSTTNSTGIIRFSGFLNIGFTFNFNLTRHLGVYTGIDLKNVGFIQHANGYIYKYRTYNVGAPIGIKLGNMAGYGGYFFLGGGLDVPVNYKEKQFQERSQKTKTSQWFSSNTPAFMPYLFVGVALRSRFTVKAQYYPGNFLNNTAVINDAQYTVHLMMLSIGYRFNYTRHPDIVKRSVQETKLM